MKKQELDRPTAPEAARPVWARVTQPHSFGEGLTAVIGELIQVAPAHLTTWGGNLHAATPEQVANAVQCACGRWFVNGEALAAHDRQVHVEPEPESEEAQAARERAEYVARRKCLVELHRRNGEAEALRLEIEAFSEDLEAEVKRCDADKLKASDRVACTAWVREQIASKEGLLREHERRLPVLRQTLGMEV